MESRATEVRGMGCEWKILHLDHDAIKGGNDPCSHSAGLIPLWSFPPIGAPPNANGLTTPRSVGNHHPCCDYGGHPGGRGLQKRVCEYWGPTVFSPPLSRVELHSETNTDSIIIVPRVVDRQCDDTARDRPASALMDDVHMETLDLGGEDDNGERI